MNWKYANCRQHVFRENNISPKYSPSHSIFISLPLTHCHWTYVTSCELIFSNEKLGKFNWSYVNRKFSYKAEVGSFLRTKKGCTVSNESKISYLSIPNVSPN